MRRYLLFTFRDKVSGNDFLADVTAHGRALAVQDADEWWTYGVEPGGLAGGGTTILEAHGEFRKTFTAVLFQLAEEAKDFWAFKEAVQAFFKEIDPSEAEAWTAAVAEVRSGQVAAKDLPVTKDGIRELPADSARYVAVERKQHFRPADSQLDPQVAVAA
ncbi:MAG: hypothetical protein ACREMB_07650 [Candidatus Rokuibacteriota bacterium]